MSRYTPQYFKNPPVETFFGSEFRALLLILKNEKSKSMYDRFNEDFVLYLRKLPEGYVKESVMDLYNKNLIYLGVPISKVDHVFARDLIAGNKLQAIILNMQMLEIDENGKTNSINEAIYATYFSLIRSAIVLNKDLVRKDKDLHKLMSTYLYLLLLRALGSFTKLSFKQKQLLILLSIYLYYKCYLQERHTYILSVIRDQYSDVISADTLNEFKDSLEMISAYNSIKDIGKIFIDTKLLTETTPSNIMLSLVKFLGPFGFYCLMGSLDFVVALSVIAKYPTELVSRNLLVESKIQGQIEDLVYSKYISNIQFNTSSAFDKSVVLSFSSQNKENE